MTKIIFTVDAKDEVAYRLSRDIEQHVSDVETMIVSGGQPEAAINAIAIRSVKITADMMGVRLAGGNIILTNASLAGVKNTRSRMLVLVDSAFNPADETRIHKQMNIGIMNPIRRMLHGEHALSCLWEVDDALPRLGDVEPVPEICGDAMAS